jgi:GAF domain-containing protein
MSQSNGRPRSWKEIAMDVVGEKDPQRFYQLIEELSAALETQLGKKLEDHSAKLYEQSGAGRIGYEKIVDAAIDLMHSDYASLQMLFPERGIGGELRLLAFRGFNPQAARFWEWVRADSQSTCGIALRNRQRVVAADIAACDFMAGSEDQEIYLQTGIHACQTTPLIGRAGNVVGMISTHWRKPHHPSEQDFRRFDILAWQAADIVERSPQEEGLQSPGHA